MLVGGRPVGCRADRIDGKVLTRDLSLGRLWEQRARAKERQHRRELHRSGLCVWLPHRAAPWMPMLTAPVCWVPAVACVGQADGVVGHHVSRVRGRSVWLPLRHLHVQQVRTLGPSLTARAMSRCHPTMYKMRGSAVPLESSLRFEFTPLPLHPILAISVCLG